MENCGNPAEIGDGLAPGLTACSACAGDYEDPDRTAQPGDLDGSETEAPGRDVTEGRISDAMASTEGWRDD